MNKKWAFYLLLGLMPVSHAFANGVTQSEVLMCMQNLPQVVIIDPDMREMNFSKSPRIDSFWNYEEKKRGTGYTQSYQNGSCLATVSLYEGDLGRLSNNKVKREMKSAVQFRQTRQDSKRIKAVRFYTAIGQEADQVNVLMLGNYEGRFLKIRTTCQYLPRMRAKEHEDEVVTVTGKLAKEIIMDLNACFEPAKK